MACPGLDGKELPVGPPMLGVTKSIVSDSGSLLNLWNGSWLACSRAWRVKSQTLFTSQHTISNWVLFYENAHSSIFLSLNFHHHITDVIFIFSSVISWACILHPFQIIPRSEGAESPGNRLDTHTVRSHLSPVESEALSICILPRPPCDSFFFFTLFIYFNWRLITLQYYTNFHHPWTWISHRCTQGGMIWKNSIH